RLPVFSAETCVAGTAIPTPCGRGPAAGICLIVGMPARAGALDAAERDSFADPGRGRHRGRRWCERGDSNPHAERRWNLNPVRLPVPPLSQAVDCKEKKTPGTGPGVRVLVGRQGFEPWTY